MVPDVVDAFNEATVGLSILQNVCDELALTKDGSVIFTVTCVLDVEEQPPTVFSA